MRAFLLSLLVALVQAQSSMSGMTMPTSSAMSSTLNATAAEYTITALPAVKTQAPCVFNCLVPIGLADPSGCDDVTNGCACLNAPNDVLDVLTDCINTVCTASTSSYAAVATSLYQSYCKSIFGAPALAQASSAEAAAAAASTTASSNATTGGIATGTPSSTAKSASVMWTPSLLATALATIGGLFFLMVL